MKRRTISLAWRVWVGWVCWSCVSATGSETGGGDSGGGGAGGSAAPGLSGIEAVVAHALEHNPDLAAVRLGIEQARARLGQAGRLDSPELNSEFKPNVAGREGTYSVGFNQRFPTLARLRAERAMSRAELAAAEAEVRDAERRVALQVRLLAVECLALEAQSELKARQAANTRELSRVSEVAAGRGEGSPVDAAQWDLEARQLELERGQIEGSRAEVLAQLRGWLGWPEAVPLRLDGRLEDPGSVPLSEVAVDPARRGDYRAALARSEAAEEGVAVARAGRWQEVGVGVFGEWDRREDLPVGIQDERMVGLRLSVPLPLWGRYRGRIDEAAATARRAEREAEAIGVRIRAEIAAARVRMDLAARQFAAVRDGLLPKAGALEERLAEMNRQGLATLTEVLRARDRRLALEASLVTVRRDYHLARARHDAAQGDGAGAEGGVAVLTRSGSVAGRLQRRRRRVARSVGDRLERRRSKGRGLWWWGVLLALVGLPIGLRGADAVSSAPIVLDAATIENLRLETAVVERREFEQTVFALGRIRVAPGHMAYVSSRVAGRALRVDAHVDARVEAGEDLVLLESRVAGDPPPTVMLRAPMSGLISSVNVVPGQPVSPDSLLLQIVALDEVHAVAAVPEHQVGLLRVGAKARLRVSAVPGREFEADLAHFGTEVDPATGTLEAAFHVENGDYRLRPGMRGEFSIVVSSRAGVLAAPREAVQGEMGRRSVFVRVPGLEGGFVRVPVVVGAENDRYVEIVKGVEAGDEVVTRGAYLLAFAGRGAASLKAALDAAHGHAHNEDGSEMEGADHDHDHEHEGEDGHAHDEEDDHDHDHDHDDDDHEDGAGIWGGKAGVWATFFACTTGLLGLLLVLMTVRGGSRGQGGGSHA